MHSTCVHVRQELWRGAALLLATGCQQPSIKEFLPLTSFCFVPLSVDL